MPAEREGQAEWLEWSGLPAELNKVRSGGWPVFKKLVELDCRAHRAPDSVEISLTELGERCGYDSETALKIVEALRRKKYLRCFLPDSFDEPALFEILMPVRTPLAPEEVARRIADPHLRDVSTYRYLAPPQAQSIDEQKVQEVVDLYFNLVSHKMNSFILEQIELAASRFELEEIRLTMERASRHELRTMGWVLKELVRDHRKRAADLRDKVNNRI